MAHLEPKGAGVFVVRLDATQDEARAHRILRAAVLRIDDKVAPLYHGQQAPPRTSELERENYQ